MHAKTESADMAHIRKNNVPGAGSYELQHLDNKNMKKSAAFSMGTSKRDYDPLMKEAKTKPGAGTHDPTMKFKKSTPSFGFGSSKRPEVGVQKHPTPAPGAYKLPSRIADVAGHSGAKGHADFHYV